MIRPTTSIRFIALALIGGAVSLGGCVTEDPPPIPPRSNILLVTVDTLRADHLSAYGYPRETSPVIDRLAAEGVRFDQPAVQWPKTGPSMASMFTATYPKDNGIVRRIGQPLPCRFEMLAETLQRAGYQTHAVVANAALASDFYFDQGFDTYIETWKLDPPEDGSDPNRAEAVTQLALGLLDRIESEKNEDGQTKPYFLWVHYLDPHAPYVPPGEWRDGFQDDEYFDPTERITIADKPRQQMTGIGRDQVLDGRDELAFYRARYDAEIFYTDFQIGRLLEEVDVRGLRERTMTVFTSDHGESLGEHRYYFDHGRFGFQTCVRVPFIVHYPGVLAPRVDEAPAELLHLTPTLLEAAGVELEEGQRWRQGRSLTPRLLGETPEAPTLAYSEAGWETKNKWQKIVRDERFKLVFAQTRPEQRWIGGEGVRFTLFDLREDPEETRNVAEEYPEDLERLQRLLSAWNGADRFDPLLDEVGGACGDERSMGGETESLLKSLGYL
ncbi:MAG: sulfatase [Acidobacteriota bacterium]